MSRIILAFLVCISFGMRAQAEENEIDKRVTAQGLNRGRTYQIAENCKAAPALLKSYKAQFDADFKTDDPGRAGFGLDTQDIFSRGRKQGELDYAKHVKASPQRKAICAQTLALVMASVGIMAPEPKLPLSSGVYAFQHRYAEDSSGGHPLKVIIKGRHVTVINERDSPGFPFPKGIIAGGSLMWHAKSGRWIIGQDPSDARAEDAGGCSDGPEVIDLLNRIYWTC